MKPLTVIQNVQEYYGRILKGTKDLKTNTCCSMESFPPSVRKVFADIDREIIDRFYGCGSPLPPALDGCTVLDLGCGTGRDVYLAAKLVGENGRVIGVDMTDEQLEVARRHVETQTRRFGYSRPNVDFKQGYIEDLAALGIEDNSVDVVISNCVLNLSPDKPRVFSEIFRVLKPGGELYFADVFAGRRVPDQLKNDPVLHGECLAGALYIEDFRRLLACLGCPDYRQISSRTITINDPESEARIGMVDFTSRTVRAFKLAELEDVGEDYGQVAVYKGTLIDWPHYFDFDEQLRFVTGKPTLICGNTAAMLQSTRYAPYFTVSGDRNVHFGRFYAEPAPLVPETKAGGCC